MFLLFVISSFPSPPAPAPMPRSGRISHQWPVVDKVFSMFNLFVLSSDISAAEMTTFGIEIHQLYSHFDVTRGHNTLGSCGVFVMWINNSRATACHMVLRHNLAWRLWRAKFVLVIGSLGWSLCTLYLLLRWSKCRRWFNILSWKRCLSRTVWS